MKRGAPIKRTQGLKSKRRPPRQRRVWSRADDDTKALIEGRYEWQQEAVKHPCRVCSSPFNITGHHVVTKQELKRLGRERYRALKWDRRNLMSLCYECHERHHTAARRVPAHLLSSENIAFAEELGLGWFLDRYYPGESDRRTEAVA